MTALSGEFPTALVQQLPGADSYKTAVVKRLKRDKLLRTYYRDGLRGLRLTSAAKQALLSCCPDRFSSVLSGDTSTNAPKYTVPHRLRLHRMAEVLVVMFHAGISVFSWEKPAAFHLVPPPADLRISRPAYYNSREVKEIGPQSDKIRGSRSTGVLLADESIFVIYNTATAKMKWEYKAELRLKALLQVEICQTRLPGQYMEAELNAVVFGAGMDQMEYLMGAGDTKTHNYFVLDGNFDHFYYLTSDHCGAVLLQLLCEAGLRMALNEILAEDLSPRDPCYPVDNDGMDETGSPVLFAYTCDMPRIRRFDTALELHGQTGTLICFDFQEEALRRICGRRVEFQVIDFEAFERSVCHTTEETD